MVILFYLDSTFKKIILAIFAGSAMISCAIFFFVNNNFVGPYSDINSHKGRKIRSTGSTSMSRLISVLSEDFMNIHQEQIYEKSETGSGSAPFLVESKDADLGDMSRYMKSSEEFDDLALKCIALDGIVIIVNKNNKISNLDKKNLVDIFSKKINDWSEISDVYEGRIVCIGREEGSGTREGFETGLGIMDPYYDIILPESGDIVAKVSNEEGAIGYISMASKSESVNSVLIEGIECNYENIKSGKYLLIRPFLQVYSKKNENMSALNKWFDYLNSERAQRIIKNERLVI